jgi:ribosome recycling factor
MTSAQDDILARAKERMTKAVAATQTELNTIRTGRANPAMLDRVVVDYYGTPTPVRQMANVSVVEGTTLVIAPYEKNQTAAIEKAIAKSDLGLSPNNDGTAIRIGVPPLSQERRKEIVKSTLKLGEEGRIAVRNIRRDAMDELAKLKKDGDLPEDLMHSEQEKVQKLTDKTIKDIDQLLAEKEKELMQV